MQYYEMYVIQIGDTFILKLGNKYIIYLMVYNFVGGL